MSYGCRKLIWFAESELWADSTFQSKSGFWRNFAMTSLKTLNTKVAVNELGFPLVTHTVYSDTWFDSYEILKSEWCAENFLDRLGRPMNNQVLGAEDTRNLARVLYKFHKPLTQLSNTYSYAHFCNHNNDYNRLSTATCGVQRIAVKQNHKRFRFRLGFGQPWHYNF
jgi:hypothetical protein